MIGKIAAAIKAEPVAISIGLSLVIHIAVEGYSRAELRAEVAKELMEARRINHQSREILDRAQTQIDDTSKLLEGVGRQMQDVDGLLQLAQNRVVEIQMLVAQNEETVLGWHEQERLNRDAIDKYNKAQNDLVRRCNKARRDYMAKQNYRGHNQDDVLPRKERRRHRAACDRLGVDWKVHPK